MRFFVKQINSISLESWCVKGTKESFLGMDSLVPVMHYGPSEIYWINLFSKEMETPFLGYKNPILDFPKEAHP